MTQPEFDKQEQLDQISAVLKHGEQVIGVYDAIGASTGFIGLTDKRVIIRDNSLEGEENALTSIPYNQVDAVSFVSDKSVFGRFTSFSTLSINAQGKKYEVRFRGEDKARHAHNIILWGQLSG